MKAWTDYPFTWLGDTAGEEAPVREIEVLSYDNDKYCRIKVCGGEDEIKSGYIYQREGRYGEVPPITRRQLEMLAHNAELGAKSQRWQDGKRKDKRMDWQQIETAPTDGTAVLVTNGRGVWIAKHKAIFQSGYKPDSPWFCLMLNKDHIPGKFRAGKPTHWMPLPEAPNQCIGSKYHSTPTQHQSLKVGSLYRLSRQRK